MENRVPGTVARTLAKVDFEDGYDSPTPVLPTDADSANIVTSLQEGEDTTSYGEPERVHYPVLDLDFPVTLVPSTTSGHFHLYLDVKLSQEKYLKLLKVLGEVGILEEGYVNASVDRGFTAVRLPWVKKDPKPSQGESSVFLEEVVSDIAVFDLE